MNPANSIVVVSRWQQPTAWTQRLVEKGYKVLLYEHGTNVNNPYNLPNNVGKEASVYLRFIIDYYNFLPSYVIFLHDEEYSWHHQGKIADLVLEAQGQRHKYHNFNKVRQCSIKKNEWWKHISAWFDQYLAPFIGPREKYGDWTMGQRCCAQFLVHRDRIHQFPKTFYEDLYGWIMTTPLDSEISARFLEWTWFLLFDKKHSPKRGTKKHGCNKTK